MRDLIDAMSSRSTQCDASIIERACEGLLNDVRAASGFRPFDASSPSRGCEAATHFRGMLRPPAGHGYFECDPNPDSSPRSRLVGRFLLVARKATQHAIRICF